jgi:hypothetical protein
VTNLATPRECVKDIPFLENSVISAFRQSVAVVSWPLEKALAMTLYPLMLVR